MLEVKKPLFIVGTGRCGSTIFHCAFSRHPQVAWLSRVCVKRPHDPRVNRWIMQALDLPILSRYLLNRHYPVEGYQFWNTYCPGFGRPCRDLLKEDVTPRIKDALRSALAQVLTRKRQRLLIKITGWPRMGFLKEVFPDARFIHIYRDGRAVVNSVVHVRFWTGWQGPANWRWGELTPAQAEKWERYGRSFIALAAIGWEILMSAYEEAKGKIPLDDLLEIRYEDMCQDPVNMFRQAVAFGDLEWSPRFEATLDGFSFRNTNYKWREQLTDAQQQVLCQCLAEPLQKYGYV